MCMGSDHSMASQLDLVSAQLSHNLSIQRTFVVEVGHAYGDPVRASAEDSPACSPWGRRRQLRDSVGRQPFILTHIFLGCILWQMSASDRPPMVERRISISCQGIADRYTPLAPKVSINPDCVYPYTDSSAFSSVPVVYLCGVC